MKLDHINISSPYELLVEVREFYCDILGLVEGYRPEFEKRGFWLYANDQALIHLFESASHTSTENFGYLDHVAFSHTGINDFIKGLQSSEVAFRTSYISDLDLTQVFLYDPAGVKLEVNFYGEKLSR